MARGFEGLRRARRPEQFEGSEAPDEPQDSAHACRIADAPDRVRVRLEGHLRTVTLRPRGGVPALEAELSDGTGSLIIVWLGRRRIVGVEPGRDLVVEGRIGVAHGARTIFNPRYELLP